MSRDYEAIRRVLRASPGALARTIGYPGIARAVGETATGGEVVAGAPRLDLEVFDEGDELFVVGEVGGVEPDVIRVYGYPAAVVIHLRGRTGRHSVPLPRRIDPASLSFTLRNGVLSVRALVARRA